MRELALGAALLIASGSQIMVRRASVCFGREWSGPFW